MGKKGKKKKTEIIVPSSVNITRDTMLSENEGTNFKVIIPDDIYQQVMWWVNMSTNEVSWFGNVIFDKIKKEFRVIKVTILDQENTGTETEITAESISKAMFELKDEEGELKWWGHSHVNMNVFWSSQDMHTIRSLGRQGWILATVFNKRQEMRSAYLQNSEVLGNQHDLFVDDIETEILRELTIEQTTLWEKQYHDNVKERVFAPMDNFAPGPNLILGNRVYADKPYYNEDHKGSFKGYSIDECVEKFRLSENFWNAYDNRKAYLDKFEEDIEFDHLHSCFVGDDEEEFAMAIQIDIDQDAARKESFHA